MVLNDSMSEDGFSLSLAPVRSGDAYHGTLRAEVAIRPWCQPKTPRRAYVVPGVQQVLLYKGGGVERRYVSRRGCGNVAACRRKMK